MKLIGPRQGLLKLISVKRAWRSGNFVTTEYSWVIFTMSIGYGSGCGLGASSCYNVRRESDEKGGASTNESQFPFRAIHAMQ